MADDLSLAVELLWRGKVVLLSVDKVTGLQVLDRHGDGERLIGGDGVTVFGVLELGGWHVARGGDGADGCGVARTGGDLLAVGDGQVGNGETKVDEVVRRR